MPKIVNSHRFGKTCHFLDITKINPSIIIVSSHNHNILDHPEGQMFIGLN